MKRIIFGAVCILTVFLMNCGGATPAPSATQVPPTQVVIQPTSAPAATQSLPTQAPAQPTTAPQPTAANIEPPSGDPFDILRNAVMAQLQAKSFRADTTLQAGDGTTSNILIEYVAPDRIHILTSEGEQIAIKGKGAWVKQGDKWEAAPPGMGDIFFLAITPEGIDQTLKMIQVKSVKFLGPELMDGKPVFVYTYETVLDLGNNKTSLGTNKAWIGALDHRVYRIEGESDSIAKPGTKEKTTVVYTYDIPITIEPPI